MFCFSEEEENLQSLLYFESNIEMACRRHRSVVAHFKPNTPVGPVVCLAVRGIDFKKRSLSDIVTVFSVNDYSTPTEVVVGLSFVSGLRSCDFKRAIFISYCFVSRKALETQRISRVSNCHSHGSWYSFHGMLSVKKMLVSPALSLLPPPPLFIVLF